MDINTALGLLVVKIFHKSLLSLHARSRNKEICFKISDINIINNIFEVRVF